MMPRENVPKSTDVIADAQVCQTRLVPFLDEDSYSVRSEAMQLRVVIGQLGLGWGGRRRGGELWLYLVLNGVRLVISIRATWVIQG